MIVNRRTINVKQIHMDDVLELLKADRERTGINFRIYAPSIAPFDVIAMEIEFENLLDYEKGWEEWGSTPEAAAFMEKWFTFTERGGTNEIWELVE